MIEKGKAKFISQNDKEATYAKKIEKTESKINWNLKAKNVVAKINALYPNPGSWFELNRIKNKSNQSHRSRCKGKPGEIIKKILL